MGAWAHDNFGNDDAMDWVGELTESDGIGSISNALDSVLELGDDYLEAPDASMALAAAEVVAALQGKPAAELPEEVNNWIRGKKAPGADLIRKAHQVVTRILKDSELKELWAESGETTLWLKEVEGLLRRLS